MAPHLHGPGDLTARARIRDAALEQFAERGFAATTMRGIGDAAGASLGLVQHHFGSKDGLRAACDDFVIEFFRDRLLSLNDEGQLASPEVLAELTGESSKLMRYLARSAVDGSPAGQEMFSLIAQGAEQFLSTTWPDRFPPDAQRTQDTATVMTAMHGGIAILLGPIAHRMGVEPDSPADSMRIAAGVMSLYGVMGRFAESGTGHGIQSAMSALRDDTPTEQETVNEAKEDQ